VPTDRLKQKSDLIYTLGKLLGPLERIVEYPDLYDMQEKTRIIARYCDEFEKYLSDFYSFCQGEKGHNYQVEYSKMNSGLRNIMTYLSQDYDLADILSTHTAKAQAAIDAIPIPKTSVILEAGSPFSAYCRLRELCEVDATKSLIWADPFVGASIFHRFLTSVRSCIPITLIVSEPNGHAGRRDLNRWTEFHDVSKLYAQEFGPERYRLIVNPQLHDRWVVFDEKRIYSLGGSAKDAGNKDFFTIASVDSSEIAKIHKHIDSGVEWFGAKCPDHR